MDDRRPEQGEGPDIDEQSLSDADETLGDRDQTASDSDQAASDRDQQASDAEQAASDWEVAHGGDPTLRAGPTAVRTEATRVRAETSGLRDETADERDSAARRRDELSVLRDALAERYDDEAALMDARDELADRHTVQVEELRARALQARTRAARDRERAGQDRRQAVLDREQAALDRERAARERDQAGTDELTGVRRRGVGLEELENEIKRARREGTALVAAYVDVDGLKAVNDEHGHAAGDDLLKRVADGLRGHMRPYDLLVRLGGDEFLCVLPVTIATARHRLDGLRSEVRGSKDGSVSVGFSELRDGDSADDLIRRADSDLIAQKRGSHLHGNGSRPAPPPG